MSADAASLPCPICLHTGVFDSAQSLRDKLIFVSTNNLTCPVCQENVCGLDKLTIHLFSHVKLPTSVKFSNYYCDTDLNDKQQTEDVSKIQQKKSKPSTTAKNKTPAVASAPIKYVRIYPKPPPLVDVLCTGAQGSEKNEKFEATSSSTSSVIQALVLKPEIQSLQSNVICDICGLQFIDSNILDMHRCLIHNVSDNSNENPTRYYCHLCSKNFKMRGSLMVHLRVAHFGFSGKPCSENSNKGSDGKKSDIVHDVKPLNLAEKNDNKQWQCDVCRKCFTTKYFLKKHKRLHTGETPYACTQCNKTFTFQQSYHKHLLYHNDEKPHTCSHCGRAFKELSTLHNHQRIHTGEKPFSCETCGKCFRQRVSYLVHRRIHTGAMPYKCTACNKSFRYKVSQRTHKCQAQPPGTVVRQAGVLVEKLKQKQISGTVCEADYQGITFESRSPSEIPQQQNFVEISESNAELVRRGAKLSLEDMESENFSLLSDHLLGFTNYVNTVPTAEFTPVSVQKVQMTESHIDDLIDSIPINFEDKNIPSPSEIFKKLCLSKDENYNVNI